MQYVCEGRQKKRPALQFLRQPFQTGPGSCHPHLPVKTLPQYFLSNKAPIPERARHAGRKGGWLPHSTTEPAFWTSSSWEWPSLGEMVEEDWQPNLLSNVPPSTCLPLLHSQVTFLPIHCILPHILCLPPSLPSSFAHLVIYRFTPPCIPLEA